MAIISAINCCGEEGGGGERGLFHLVKKTKYFDDLVIENVNHLGMLNVNMLNI